MIYVCGYLAIGVAVLTVVYFSHRLSGQMAHSSINDALSPARRNEVLEHVLVPLLAAALVIVAWPVAIGMRASEFLQNFSDTAEKRASVFTISHADLHEKISIEEIERREFVEDPLGGVPELPFGHLHDVWLRFKTEAGLDSEIWTFSAIWNAQWHDRQQRTGYVIVRKDRIGSHLLWDFRMINSPYAQECESSKKV